MKIGRKLLFLMVLAYSASNVYSQGLALGQWRVHLPWVKGVSVADAGGKVFCAAQDGLFSYDKSDSSLSTYSKVNGLSDEGLAIIRYDPSYDLLTIAYDDANLDLLFPKQIVSISDIKRKNIVGSKSINDILYVGRYAYLSCGFGIVVVDLEKTEVKDTYYIGPNGANINVSSMAFDGSNLFAATDSGVYQININDPNINVYSAWSRILTDNSGIQYTQIVYFNNKVYLKVDVSNNSDYILSYDYSSWSNTGIGSYDMQKLQVANNKLVVSGTYDIKVFDSSLQQIAAFTGNNPSAMKDATYDDSGNTWIADNNNGLVQINSSSQVNYIVPNGPRSSYSADIKIVNNQLWVAHSVQGRKWAPLNSHDCFSTFVDDKWTTYNKGNMPSSIVSLDTLTDFMALDIDPLNSSHVYFGSRGRGLLEIENGAIKNYYNTSNSTLQYVIGYYGFCATGGVGLDKSNNLWVVNSNVSTPLCERKSDGTWQAYSFPVNPPFLTNSLSNAFMGELFIDSYGQIWMDNNETGTLVFDPTSGKYQFLNSQEGTGHLPNADVRAIAEDRDGQIWIGTSSGVAVFYNPSAILTGSNFDAQQVLLLQDGNYQYLLATDVVTAISVDGANRKWFGTESSGVYLMSADGTKQILHFTQDNSPLLSDNITSIGINQKTGEVFFGTDRGIVSYRGDATEGGDKCDDYYVFPNPVAHDYHGPIAIQGLVANASVKITDVSGQVVYQTKSKGGLATWDGNNFSGNRAKTGIYLVYVTNDDGSATCVTKMLFTN